MEKTSTDQAMEQEAIYEERKEIYDMVTGGDAVANFYAEPEGNPLYFLGYSPYKDTSARLKILRGLYPSNAWCDIKKWLEEELAKPAYSSEDLQREIKWDIEHFQLRHEDVHEYYHGKDHPKIKRV
jgi:hypothetical protein